MIEEKRYDAGLVTEADCDASRKACKLSIVIACLNAGNTIAGALDSICSYGGDSEIVIVDGGSTDATLQILERYRNRIARLISEPDQGIYDALSKGFRIARGTWVYVLGSDDRLLPGFESMTSQLDDPDVVYYASVRFSPSGRLSQGRKNSFGLCLKNINHQAIFFPKEHWTRLGGFAVEFPLFADYALNLKAYWDRYLVYRYVDEVVCEFHQFGASGLRPDPAFAAKKLSLIRKCAPFRVAVPYRIAVLCKRAISSFLGRRVM
jgi:glycosyltransferase involved in cell wall biosynthesis